MNRVTLTASMFIVVLLPAIVSGCVLILPESQNLSRNATQTNMSNANITFSVQSLGERQRYSVTQFVSYNAKVGYKLALYEVNVTNLDGVVEAGTTSYFTLAVDNGTEYGAALTTFSPHVIGNGESLSGIAIFEVPQSAVPREVRYNDGNNRVTVGV